MFRVWCKFEKNYENPFTGRVGRWRVFYCNPSPYRALKGGSIFLALHTVTFFKRGTIINPTKELKKVMAARKATA